MSPIFFPNTEALRQWFAENHANLSEAWIGYYKKSSGKPSITWSESVDEALCVGWIDGIIKSIDNESYMHRFTPRRPNSIWSAVNIKKVAELTAQKRMLPAGIAAFEKRKEEKSGIYAFEQENVAFSAEYLAIFQTNTQAWTYFQSQRESYTKQAIWWVMSAKQGKTQKKRLAELINESENGQHLKQYRRN
jgi:uncharacterized protein YdeI (YjbR/CyaY-like superfamily)